MLPFNNANDYREQKSSSNSKRASDNCEENVSNKNVLKDEAPLKIPICNRGKHLRNSNIAELNNIFNIDTRKTIELSSHCKEVINRELTFWQDRIQFEMKQIDAIMRNLYERMERIKGLNRELRNLLVYFKDDTDSTVASSTCSRLLAFSDDDDDRNL
uniref:Uncharacterized protein n=1 Tax=Setaria digitata TaxID=48799 RepID=A0A915PY32_9BILA